MGLRVMSYQQKKKKNRGEKLQIIYVMPPINQLPPPTTCYNLIQVAFTVFLNCGFFVISAK